MSKCHAINGCSLLGTWEEAANRNFTFQNTRSPEKHCSIQSFIHLLMDEKMQWALWSKHTIWKMN